MVQPSTLRHLAVLSHVLALGDTIIRFERGRPLRLIGEKSALIGNHEPMIFLKGLS
jgi:hypothetical protein